MDTSRAERRGGSNQRLDPADRKGEGGDISGYTPTPEDLRLQEVYEDWVHPKPDTRLDGGIGDDEKWQGWWRDLTVMPSRRYDAPSGKVGRRFVVALVGEMRGVRDRLWNSERFIIFQTVILKQSQHGIASQAIRRKIEKRMDAWEAGHHRMLV